MSENLKVHSQMTQFHATGLFRIALNAYSISKAKGIDGSHPARPITAIVFSAVTLEAVMNEIHFFAINGIPFHADGPHCGVLRTMLRAEVAGEKARSVFKAMMIHFVLAGKPFDMGGPPYQDFAFLFDLRNKLVHPQPWKKTTVVRDKAMVDIVPNPTRKTLDGLRTRKLLRSDLDSNLADWPAYVSSPETEGWACETVVRMVDAFADAAGRSELRPSIAFLADILRKAWENA